eukprot:87391-Ditylum_brightwellii.AAC.1
MAKEQLQPNELVFTNMHGALITSLDNDADGIAGVDDAMVEETIEQQDAPTQIIEQEEMVDSSRPSDHTTPAFITQPQQTHQHQLKSTTQQPSRRKPLMKLQEC